MVPQDVLLREGVFGDAVVAVELVSRGLVSLPCSVLLMAAMVVSFAVDNCTYFTKTVIEPPFFGTSRLEIALVMYA